MGKITINEIHKSLFGYIQAVSDESLETKDKTIVGAINELIQNSNSNKTEINNLTNEISNGKQLIANAIGSPLSSDDTFAAMGNEINQMTIDFRNALAVKGVNAPADKMERLIERIDEIIQSGNVLNIQTMVSGEYTLTQKFGKDGVSTLTVPLNLDFEPDYFVICIPKLTQKSGNELHPSYAVLTPEYPTVEYFQTYMSASSVTYYNVKLVSYDSTSCVLKHASEVGYVASGTVLKWYAVGAGSDQIPNNGGERIITPSTTDQVLPDGYYSGDITIKGDEDLKSENIVEGVEIFGVTGSASSIKLSLGDVTNFNHDFFTKKESTSGAGSGVVVLEYTIPFTGSYKIYYDWQGPSINALRYGIVKFLINDVERGNVRLSGTNRGTDAVYDLTSVNKGDRLVIKIGADDSYPGSISNIRIKGNLVIEGVDF